MTTRSPIVLVWFRSLFRSGLLVALLALSAPEVRSDPCTVWETYRVAEIEGDGKRSFGAA